MNKWNKGLTTSNTVEWATPQNVFDQLDIEFEFDIDVCATKENAKCKKFYTLKDNGLVQEWRGGCFMNPPYGREIGEWCRKAYEESRNYARVVVGLLPARTDTKWFHNYIYGKAEVRFIKGRLKFGDSKNSAPFPSMIVIWKLI
jgi:site-specific DNA-methyltransferase (adenine-specific)